MNLPFQRDQLANQLKTVDAMNVSIDILERQYQLSLQQTQLTVDSAAKSQDLLEATREVRDNIANVDDQFRPIRNYLLGTALLRHPDVRRHPLGVRLAGRDRQGRRQDSGGAGKHRSIGQPALQLTALLPQTIASMKVSRDLSLASLQQSEGLLDQMQAMNDTALAMGASFDQAKNDDLFYLPPEYPPTPISKRGLEMFLSPDGKSAGCSSPTRAIPRRWRASPGSTANARPRRRPRR